MLLDEQSSISHYGSAFRCSLTTFMTQTLFKFHALVLVIATYYVVITDLGNIIENLSLEHGLIKVVKFSHMGRVLLQSSILKKVIIDKWLSFKSMTARLPRKTSVSCIQKT